MASVQSLMCRVKERIAGKPPPTSRFANIMELHRSIQFRPPQSDLIKKCAIFRARDFSNVRT